jgi:iron complex transport system substrate-binding protein
VDESADLEMAINIALNAKTQRPSVCNAAETLLVNENWAKENLAALVSALEDAGVPCGYFSVTDWREYMALLKNFTALTGRDDLYLAQVETVQQPIEALLAQAQKSPEYGEQTALLLRTYVTSVRAKDSESTVAGRILKDMGLVNIADGDDLLAENLTMEAIIMADPDYIFAVTMGADEEGAVRMLEQTLLNNPAWNTLTAVREGRFIMLERTRGNQAAASEYFSSIGIHFSLNVSAHLSPLRSRMRRICSSGETVQKTRRSA